MIMNLVDPLGYFVSYNNKSLNYTNYGYYIDNSPK
jgi:hypothetical protein